jgi:hypothetical protein
MTNKNEHIDIKHMDNNLDRLLELGEPIPGMPEDLKNQIRSKLVQMAPEPEKKSILTFRWAALPLAAAAALVLFLLVPWKGDLNGSISWADVQKQLVQVRTVSYRGCNWMETSNGEQKMSCAKVYHKDPGLSRADEVMGVKPGVNKTYIFKRESGRYDLLMLNPESHQADLETRLFNVENGWEPRFSPFITTVSKSWEKMKEITEDKTRIVGDRVINGIPAVGFSFDIEDFCFPGGDLPVMEQTFGELWVNREDGTPMLAEIEIKIGVNSPFTQKVHIEYTDIQWNIPLEKSLFNLDVPEGWQLNKKQIETMDYEGNKLALGVTLNIYAPGQESMITAEDVVGIVQVLQTSYPDSDLPNTIKMTIELTHEAAQRLHDYADTHFGTLIGVNFDDELNTMLELDTNHPNRISFYLSRLSLSPSEIEERYFTSSTQRN